MVIGQRNGPNWTGSLEYVVDFNPFKISQYIDGALVLEVNKHNTLYMENTSYFAGSPDQKDFKNDCLSTFAREVNSNWEAKLTVGKEKWPSMYALGTSKYLPVFGFNQAPLTEKQYH